MSATASLLEQIRGGTANRDLLLMAAEGILPVPPEELVPLQVELTRHPDTGVSTRAEEALRQVEPRIVASLIQGGAEIPILQFFALESDRPKILSAILRRRDVPANLLVAIAPNLGEELQEELLLRQDAIVEEPRILAALEGNTRLSNYARRRIREYRDHLLPKEKKPEPAPSAEEDVSEEEIQRAIEEVKAKDPGEEKTGKEAESQPEETTGLTDVQIRSLPVPVRATLARRSPGRSLRNILVRDSNSMVATSCLQSSQWSDQEVEQICSSRNIHEDVLLAVSRNRQWMSRYNIINAMVRNPRAPTGPTMKLVPRLSVRDLRDLSRDRNVPDVIRQTALRLYRIKFR